MFSRKIELDPALIEELSRLLEANNLTEIEVQHGSQRIRVSRGGTVVAAATGLQRCRGSSCRTSRKRRAISRAIRASLIRRWSAPLTASPEPGAKPFVEEGDAGLRRPDDPDRRSDEDHERDSCATPGKVTKILIEDGQPVEFGEPLLILE